MRFAKTIVLTLLSLSLMNCQTMPYQGKAREVKKRAGEGGVIAMALDHRDEDRKVAEDKMRATCGNNPFRIQEEGEVAVGTKSVQNDRSTRRDDTRKDAGSFLGMNFVTGEAGGVDSKTESVTEAVKEWQITYDCTPDKSKKTMR